MTTEKRSWRDRATPLGLLIASGLLMVVGCADSLDEDADDDFVCESCVDDPGEEEKEEPEEPTEDPDEPKPEEPKPQHLRPACTPRPVTVRERQAPELPDFARSETCRLQEVRNESSNPRVQETWSHDGNKITVDRPNPTSPETRTTWEFDDEGHLRTIDERNFRAGGPSTLRHRTWDFDQQGRLQKRRLRYFRNGDSRQLIRETVVEQRFAKGRLTERTTVERRPDGGRSRHSVEAFRYEPDGLRSRVEIDNRNAPDRTIDWTYADGRVVIPGWDYFWPAESRLFEAWAWPDLMD